jgi:putative ABC transport system permease protein
VGDLSFYDPKELVIRYSGAPAPILAAVRRIVRTADPDQPISDVRMLADIVADQTAPRRALLQVLGALAGIALLLSAVGIHGLLAYTVSQRAHEIGVRLALGAEPGRVARMVLADGMRLAAAGIVVGVALAYVAARGMSTLLFGVEPGDPSTFATAIAVVSVVTIVGATIPALRAVRVSPSVMLRVG